MFRESERLLFRELVEQDQQSVLAYRRLSTVKRFDTFGPNTEKEVTEIIRKALSWQREEPRTRHYGAVCLKSTKVLIGEYNLSIDKEASSAEVGFMFHPNYWGKGFAFETLEELQNYAKECGVTKIVGTCDPKNLAAINVMSKAGMIQVSGGKSLRYSKELPK